MLDYDGICAVYQELDLLHAEALPTIFRRLDRPATARKFVADAIKKDDAILLVAESEGRIVGVGHVCVRDARDYPMFLPRKYAWVESLAVGRDCQRRGIGRVLMECLHEWAIDKGVVQIELNVWEFNQGAISFYETLGYETASRRMWKKFK